MKTVDNYIDQINPDFIPAVLKLRSILINTLPGIKEKISYSIPFYYYYGPICYINVRKNYVDLGFTKGYALTNRLNVLDMKNRKQVASMKFYKEKDINEGFIKEILIEAASINEFQALIKKR